MLDIFVVFDLSIFQFHIIFLLSRLFIVPFFASNARLSNILLMRSKFDKCLFDEMWQLHYEIEICDNCLP